MFDAIVQLHAIKVIKAGMLSKYSSNATSYKVKHDSQWQELLSSSALDKVDHVSGMGGTNCSLSPNTASVPAEADSSPVCELKRECSEVHDHSTDTRGARQEADS